MEQYNPSEKDEDLLKDTELLCVRLRADLYRAFRRCVWIMINETGKNQIEIHNEMFEELLKLYEC